MAEQEKGEASEALSELFQDIEKRTGLTHIPGAGFWSAKEIEVLKDVGHGVLRHTPSVWEQVRESAWADVSHLRHPPEAWQTINKSGEQ